MSSCNTDRFSPLKVLPQELVVQIFSLLDFRSLTRLESTSTAYLNFLSYHQEGIWAPTTLENLPSEAGLSRDRRGSSWASDTSLEQVLESKQDLTDDHDYWDGISTWKQLCKRQILLSKNWDSTHPTLKLDQRNDSKNRLPEWKTWRFRHDFKRRIVLMTGVDPYEKLSVLDMNDQQELWSLHSPAYTHLEYDNGYFARDCGWSCIEIWKAEDLDGGPRGHFKKVSTLQHDQPTRGFHLKYPHLCVVSHRGFVWVYDISSAPTRLVNRIEIPWGAVGHIDQNEEIVMPSLGNKGYHVYEKATGALIGSINPSEFPSTFEVTNRFRLKPDFSELDPYKEMNEKGSMAQPCKLVQHQGNPCDEYPGSEEGAESGIFSTHQPLEDDEWGAGMVCGDHLVGVSRGGRVLICSDWKGLLETDPEHREEKLRKCVALIWITPPGSLAFDYGGWLSIGYGRAAFEET